jgi:hypothetical protein
MPRWSPASTAGMTSLATPQASRIRIECRGAIDMVTRERLPDMTGQAVGGRQTREAFLARRPG